MNVLFVYSLSDAPSPPAKPLNVMKEIKEILEEFIDISEIYFEVETITANEKWALAFCQLLEKFNASRETPISFGINVRVVPNKSLKHLSEAFKRAGFNYINLGIESGSERIRNEIMKRIYSNEDLIRTCDEAHEAGLQINAYNMIGLPGETPEDFKMTIEVNRRCRPESNNLSIFFPYPGTELYQHCLERGLNVQLKEESIERYKPVLGLPEFPDKLVSHYFRWFEWYVYKHKKPLFKILSFALLRFLGAHPHLFHLYRLLTFSGPAAALKQRIRSFSWTILKPSYR